MEQRSINALSAAQDAANQVKEKLSAHTVEIGGDVIKIVPLGGYDGLDMWEYLMKVLLPSVGTGLDSFQHDTVMDGSPTTFSEAMMHLSNKLEGNTLKNVSISLLSGMTVNGQKVDLDEWIGCNYGAWRQVLKFALTENFSSFFENGWVDGVQDLMAMVTPAMGSTSEEP